MDSTQTSRYARYRKDDLPPLVKLAVAEEFTAKLIGEHEFEGTDGPLPVLEFEDSGGKPFAWRAGAWRAIDALAKADPKVGDIVEVRRLPDQGMSHVYSVRVVEQKGPSDVPF